MSLLTLIISNLKYYWKPYLAIIAGTVISTAVLTGALIVGDSVKYSLGQLTDIRLGTTRFAVQSGDRFFRQQLAGDLVQLTKTQVAPVLQLEGIALNADKNTQINRVDILGIDERFMNMMHASAVPPGEDEAILSRNTAEKLNLKTGEVFILKIRKQPKAPANAPFVSEKEPLVTMRLKVAAIADDKKGGRFTLKSNQSAPFNIFIALAKLAPEVELTGNANLLLIGGNENMNTRKLDSLLRLAWQPEDAGLEFRNISESKIEIRSSRIFIDTNTSKAIQTAIPDAEPILTYLVNAISTSSKSTPYSFVTAADSGIIGQQLSENEILISNWLSIDLQVKPGDSVTLRYFTMGSFRKLTEDSARFVVKAVLPMTNAQFDRTLMPDFPGMSDVGNCREWETGAPVDLKRIRDKDEQYWNDFRGTPKAFISISAGQKLWDNAFGNATAFRFPADNNQLPLIKSNLMKYLNPPENGLSFQDIYSEGQSGAANSTDFGGLFLSLSFFIIVAAILLIALLFSLHMQKRMAETAVLTSLGFRKSQIIRILCIEASLAVITGSILGTISGIFYNKLIILGLNTLWQDAVRTQVLQLHLIPSTLLLGFASGIITALLAMLIVLLQNLRKPLSTLIKGVDIPSPAINRRRITISLSIALLAFGLAVIVLVYSVFSVQSNNSETYLSAGGMILVSGMCFLYFLLLRTSQKTTSSIPGFFTLILRNVSIKMRRTLAAVALLAIGTFSVIITGANRKTFYGIENSRQSGSGGFLLWAESTIPVLNDLNSPEGKAKYALTDEPAFTGARFIQMLRLDGDDASCLNLNQVSMPALLGINPQYFDEQQAFNFLQLDRAVSEHHPWLALSKPLAAGIIPGFADQTVIQWGLRKKIGDTILYRDESGKTLKVKIMGGLDNSVFQGNILVSAELFRQFFPSVAGSRVMMIDGGFSQRSAIQERLEYLFDDYGMVVTPASEKLAQFNSVENTYLSVFMILGGLGILIGTIGLGIVLLQNLTERKREIALYQAIGFRNRYISKLIVTENLFILLSGIGIGLLAAFAGILPSFFSPAFQLPAAFLLVIILLVLLNGMAWIYFPTKIFLRKNLVEILKKE